MTFRYRAYGRTIASGIELSDLPAGAGAPAVTITTMPVRGPVAPTFVIWPAERTAPTVRAARDGAGYCIEYDGSSRFAVSPRGDRIDADLAGCAPACAQHRLLDQVLPLALSLEHGVLHAGAAAKDGAAVAFIGPAGSGKSTLTRACAKRGWSVVADDAAVVRPDGSVVPSYPGLRLLRGDGTKDRVTRGLHFEQEEVALAAVYTLDSGASRRISVVPLSVRDAAVALVGQLFRLEQQDRVSLERELALATALAASVPVFRLEFPRDGDPDAVVAQVMTSAQRRGVRAEAS